MKLPFYFVFCVAHIHEQKKKKNLITIKLFIWLFISVISIIFLLSRQSNKTFKTPHKRLCLFCFVFPVSNKLNQPCTFLYCKYPHL